ncbi:hypothetical protein [Marinomonas sp. 2405UD68-3]|uniref:hypothetical protein n=1 Tax=Marinomonas sp. 2405UD68-3 TaxID=3391835 RepID=UPI0039C978E9
MKFINVTGILILAVGLTACDIFSNPSEQIPNSDLRSKWRECTSISNPSRTKALACDNYERECDRRKGKGNLVCY